MNTDTEKSEVIGSEFLFNKAQIVNRRKGIVAKTYQKNIDGTYSVVWVRSNNHNKH